MPNATKTGGRAVDLQLARPARPHGHPGADRHRHNLTEPDPSAGPFPDVVCRGFTSDVQGTKVRHVIGLRDSDNPDGPILQFSEAEITALLHRARHGTFGYLI